MKRYLLDTCICVFLLRKQFGIVEKLESLSPNQCYIADITIAELKYGAYKSNKCEENLALINELISMFNVVPFAESIDFYASEKNRLRLLGTPIEDFDLLIASAARAMDLVLVTDNLKHFNRVSNLQVENWMHR